MDIYKKVVGQTLVTAVCWFSFSASIMATSFAEQSSDYLVTPPFLSQGIDKPNVVISLDVSGSMTELAYPPGNNDSFDPELLYYGYYSADSSQDSENTDRRFSYRSLTINGDSDYYFVEDENGEWSGSFLNWLTMRRMDVVRKVLVGGKVRDRGGEQASDGRTYYVAQQHKEPSNNGIRTKTVADTENIAPLSANTPIRIADGFFYQQATSSHALTEHLEAGLTEIPAGSGSSVTISFENDYTDPVVIASILSNNDSEPATVRVIDITDGQATIQLQEYPYQDGHHGLEQVFYLVAEKGNHSIPLANGESLAFVAGSQSVSSTSSSDTGQSISFSNPVFSNNNLNVFAGISSNNETETVIVRTDNITASGFRAQLQEQWMENGSGNLRDQVHAAEQVHYLAIEHGEGMTASGFPIENARSNNVDHEFKTISFSSNFQTPPRVIAGMQTRAGRETANVRFKALTSASIEFNVSEDNSNNRGVSHIDETIGYLAIGQPHYKLQLALTEEPKGIIQERDSEFRFGVAVYNFDHNKSDIYNDNTVHGGTLYPCYPEFAGQSKNLWPCKPTHVRAPINNIIDVIEDHPLIWGGTPIAETMYEIWGYFQQKDHNRHSSQPQYYDNGDSDQPSYIISSEWDPYRNESNDLLACTSSYILNFNDGAPYNDFDGSGHPDLIAPLTPKGKDNREALDEVSHQLRITDARSSSGNAIDGFQGITSFFIFAALGSNEQNSVSTRRMREAAAAGGFTDLDKDNELDGDIPDDFQVYYNNVNLPDQCQNNINEWDTDGDCNPEGFFLASDGDQLTDNINSALDAFALTSASGGAASLVSSTTNGTGSFVRGLFTATGSADSLPWTGDINAIMVDRNGLLRSDDGDRILEDYATDPIIDTCFSSSGERRVRVQLSTSIAARPTAEELSACNLAGDESDLGYLWSAQDWLSGSNLNPIVNRTYSATNDRRYIFTWLDTDNDQTVDSDEVINFLPDLVDSDNAGIFRASTTVEAQNIVRFTRGEEITGLRSRTLDGKVYRLGDNIYSTPRIVSRPAENLDLLYNDSSYLEFFQTYQHRRQVIYAGTNDGLLHAFNGGYYDKNNKRFLKAPPSRDTNGDGVVDYNPAQYELGAEIWAYAPYNLLPHLKYLTNPSYGQGDGDHLSMMDLQARIFDAKVFCSSDEGITSGCTQGQTNVKHPGGWGTMLVAGMRLGGGKMTVDPDNDPATTDNALGNRTLQSAYVILDITDPEKPPRLLKEFTHPNLGFTTSDPTLVRMKKSTNEDGWYLFMGSGPSFNYFSDVSSNQNAHLFMMDLTTMALVNDFGSNGALSISSAPNSFIGDLTAADWNLDYYADSLYFGTVKSNSRDELGSTNDWGGSLYRLNIQDFTVNSRQPTNRTSADLAATVLVSDTGPIFSKSSITQDESNNRWVFAGAGRFFNLLDAADISSRYYFGAKEPRDTQGAFTLGSLTSSNLVDVSDAEVRSVTGEVSNLDSLLGEENNTFTDLDLLMRSYATGSPKGWKRLLGSGERVIGRSSLLADLITFTPYAPPAESCTFEGNSYIYSLHYTTGTPSEFPALGTDGDTQAPKSLYKVRLGSAPVVSVTPFAGSPDSNQVIHNTIDGTGSIRQIDSKTEGGATSSAIDWRQMQ